MTAALDHSSLLIPGLLKLDELDAITRERVSVMAGLHGSGPDVVPSLYLHLANWPEFLRAACTQIAPLLQDGSIERARRVAVEFAESGSKALLSTLPIGSATIDIPEPAMHTLERFIEHIIPEMLPIGLAIERALPANLINETSSSIKR